MFSARLSYAVTDPARDRPAPGPHRGHRGQGLRAAAAPRACAASRIEVDSVREAVVGAFCLYCMPDGHPALKAALERRLPVVVVDEPQLARARSSSASRTARARALPPSTCAALGHEHVAVIVDRLRDDRTGDRIIDAARIARRRTAASAASGSRATSPASAGRCPSSRRVENAAGRRRAGARRRCSRSHPARPRCSARRTSSRSAPSRRSARPGSTCRATSPWSATTTCPMPCAPGSRPCASRCWRRAARPAGSCCEPNTEREVILPVELVVRGSTDPAA